ncbi:MAG: hypothetical protein AVDCRST_MAG66-4419 [uncultured Pseudonocardia sp.]|uniref:OmpR/PhoB-type domain-containing protein n=1 Tax=uncultured Pseudonocardia sp. TaxID=211455 RepID=A0A6J4QEY3_9PSEU|nr:MAG: hypothetical protein AVDCRST_MAG66-4419 [uncultured Pseudonocardia sp.]
MEFRILGPLEATSGGCPVEVGGPRQQVVLALLLLSAPGLVPISAFVDALWPDDPPATAREQVQICISRLRQRLDLRSGPTRIVTRSPGYALEFGPAEFDLARFGADVQAGRAAAAGGRLEEAARILSDALERWRGPTAAPGIDSAVVRDAATRLEEQRITVLEEYVDLKLRLGLHAHVLDLLGAEIAHHPLRERLRGQLMLALLRSGRQGDALREYRRARQASIDELGLEPADELRRLEEAIIVGDAALSAPTVPDDPAPAAPAAAVPRQLPTSVADFTGRVETSAALLTALDPARAEQDALPTAIVSGPGGIGKSALAVHVATRLAGQYPDGQLYAVLHGMTRPEQPTHVLERFLRALGVPAVTIPDALDERAALYRAILADRRVLVLLDDISSAGQVEPLLPSGGGCGVLLTSQKRITALPGAHRVELGTFSNATALALLDRVVGTARTGAAGADADELVRLCGHLPLAIRIAGARLVARPDWSVGDMVDRIEEAGQLDELHHEDMALRASLETTYRALDPDARRLLRRLALVDAPAVGAWVCSPLLDMGPRAAQDLLGELLRSHLVETAVDGASGVVTTRYRMHDLVRVFARERAAVEEDPDEQVAVIDRFLGGFLHLLESAHRQEYGGDFQVVRSRGSIRYPIDERLAHRLVSHPLRWLGAEREAVVAAVEQAAVTGRIELCWSLATAAVTLFEARAHYDEWRHTHQVALAAARTAGDRLGEAALLTSLASLRLFEGRIADAREPLSLARELFTELHVPEGIGMVLRHQAFIDRARGDTVRARARYNAALTVFRRNRDQIGEASVLNGMAQLDIDAGHDEQAVVALKEAAQICARVGNRRVGAQVAHRLGEVHLRHGRLDEAFTAYAQVREFAEHSGDPVARVFWLAGTGFVAAGRGEHARGVELLGEAYRLSLELGQQRMQARLLLGLSAIALARGRLADAAALVEQALAVSRRLGNPLDVAAGELHLGDVEAAAGEPERAAATWTTADRRLRAAAVHIASDVAQQLADRLRPDPLDDPPDG